MDIHSESQVTKWFRDIVRKSGIPEYKDYVILAIGRTKNPSNLILPPIYDKVYRKVRDNF